MSHARAAGNRGEGGAAPAGSAAGSERGSASVWVLAAAGLVLLAAFAAALGGTAVLARHRAERTADLAALAGAGRIGVSTGACAAAARVATANGATLGTCRVLLSSDGRSGTVAVTISAEARFPAVGDRNITARAIAGRLPYGQVTVASIMINARLLGSVRLWHDELVRGHPSSAVADDWG